jgi:hypothetical protein
MSTPASTPQKSACQNSNLVVLRNEGEITLRGSHKT